MHNYRLGLSCVFSSEQMTVQQKEYLLFEQFQDQTCKIFEVLRQKLEINRILAPSFRVNFQTPFDLVQEAENFISSLRLCLFRRRRFSISRR